MGFSIPQIGKEFDLLRIGDCVLNIEIKSESDNEKVKKQLVRNNYYLSMIGKDTFCFTYILSSNTIFYLEKNDIRESSLDDLFIILRKQKDLIYYDIDKIFEPSKYLVSPFNQTELFIEGKYFLTNQQEEIKNKIINCDKENAIISVQGSPGTGKTLLLYDIVREIINFDNSDYLVIHCGLLNEGHEKLISRYDYKIIGAKMITSQNIETCKYIYIDEAQRIYMSQLKHIISHFKGKFMIISYDKKQYLSNFENKEEKFQYIEDSTDMNFKLSNKIRTNENLSNFILKYNSRKIGLYINSVTI